MLLQYSTTVVSAVQQTTKHWGRGIGFPALNENVEQGYFFPYGAVKKAQYSTRLLYEPQMHCTRNAFLLFSSEVSAYCNYLQILYFMNSYHDKMVQKCFSTPEQ
ncbi:methylcrotonoyl-CoA carboxylase beta chain, mitochondrial-like [Platysternon megacephalum]|uniref:Methylcrotonoyl-CoA carboxylase beta chain, mitochondrial-like n=1 Tax=Platysternon megacephalum TaxID=55544 RepID=A0A4D9E2A4_9SAUR|nr:methylcrotonoyl-CoA carboxylase beta chain, mitochondrial-like [Platysternon megacephalum]